MPDQHLSARDGEILIFLPDRSALAHAGKIDGPRRADSTDQRCRNHGARLKIADELDALVSEWTSVQPRDAMVEGLIEAGIPCAPVRTVEESDRRSRNGAA